MPKNRQHRSRLLSLSITAALLVPLGVCAPATAAGTEEPVQKSDTKSTDSSVLADFKSKLSQSASLTNSERIELASEATEALGDKILDAQMGQGAKRVAETGDPTVPTMAELSQLGTQLAQRANKSAGTKISAPASLEELVSWRPPGVQGIDVSRYQGTVDWKRAKANGVQFAYIKSTQSWPSSVYKDPMFNTNYNAAKSAGVIRGAYHFAMPAHSSGATQAKEFLKRGGGWSNDGTTLPPLVDLEWNPYSAKDYPQGKGDICYGMTPSELTQWIKDFGQTVKNTTGRLPMIYTARSWWDDCTGDSTAFKNWPLHVAMYPTANDIPKNPRELPEGWTTFNMWQYSSNANLLGSNNQVDANVWNGDLTSLKDFAKNTRSTSYKLTTSYLGNGDVVPTRLAPTRMSGANRYGTPVDISKQTFPSGSKFVVVASGENFPDALSASPLAGRYNAPLLLTKKDYLPSEVAAEIRRLNPDKIVVVGGPSAVSSRTVTSLKKYATVSRAAGSTRYGTSAKVAAVWSPTDEVFVARGSTFPDALSMAAVSVDHKSPMLLSGKDSLSKDVLAQLKRLKPKRVNIAGGTLAVSSSVESQIRKAVPGVRIYRYGGATRYDTSSIIAQKFWPKGSQRQFISNGRKYPDGLTGAVAAGHNGAPLMLAKKTCLPSSVATALKSMEGWTSVLVGGPLVLDETVAYRNDGKLNICS